MILIKFGLSLVCAALLSEFRFISLAYAGVQKFKNPYKQGVSEQHVLLPS